MDVEHIGHATSLRWNLLSVLVGIVAVVLGIMIGPAGPAWWRVPLVLIDHLPGVSVHSGVSAGQWSIIWNIRMPRVVLAGIAPTMPASTTRGMRMFQMIDHCPALTPLCTELSLIHI